MDASSFNFCRRGLQSTICEVNSQVSKASCLGIRPYGYLFLQISAFQAQILFTMGFGSFALLHFCNCKMLKVRSVRQCC